MSIKILKSLFGKFKIIEESKKIAKPGIPVESLFLDLKEAY
jgi:hypothetical protein